MVPYYRQLEVRLGEKLMGGGDQDLRGGDMSDGMEAVSLLS